MRWNSDKTFIFIYITLIIASILSTITIINESPLFIQQITGKPVGTVGICVATTPSFSHTLDNQTSYVGYLFEYDINASATGSPTLFYEDNTSLFDIDSSTGLISFTPATEQIGNHSITIYVNNTICNKNNPSDTDEFLMEIIDASPILDSIGTLEGTEDTEFYYDVDATDPLGLTLTFATNTSIFTINPSTGEINFTPSNSDVGSHSILFNVTNSLGLYDSEIVNFTIYNVNDAPVLDLIPNFTVAEGTELYEDLIFEYDVNATDIDGDEIKYYDDTSLFVIGEDSGLILFTPTQNDVGNHTVEIFAVDGTSLDSQTVLFEIIEVNDPPILDAIGTKTVEVSSRLEFFIYATDEEGNYPLTFLSNDTIMNLTAYNDTSAFVNTTYSEAANYSINITVNDSTGLESSEIISFSVVGLNNAPEIDTYYPPNLAFSIDEGSTQLFNISFHDPDGNTPSVQWYLDNSVQAGEIDNQYSYSPNYNSQGIHTIMAMVSDGLLTANKTWTVTVNDVTIAAPSGGTGGGGGGGGGGGARCAETWTCSDWSSCQNSGLYLKENYYKGFQTRRCIDWKNCGTALFKPKEEQECIYTPIETCFDGIKNQNEIMPDCGGICKACPTCDDQIKNQNEEEVDCGGPCRPCYEIQKPKSLTSCGDGKISLIEIFICPKDSWWILLILLTLIITILYYVKEKKKQTPLSVAKKKSEKERYQKIKELYKLALESARAKNHSQAKMTCSRIEMIYAGIDPSSRFRRKSLRKIKRLNKTLNRIVNKN
ncbi:MAG: hypothetical protein PHG05_00880 [Candidatus Nanoarchaeia archaeon]|nr:hypothetical protein [Candidatus Nanoarchaeia archaeon]